jgi:hypothetical protein
MSSRPSSGAALRQLAREFLSGLAEEEFIPESQREDLARSLVRQWITYDGNAALLVDRRLLWLATGHSPLGRLRVVPTSTDMGWDRLIEDWKIEEDQLPEARTQLNLAQSAELTNSEKVQLRLWIDPQKRGRGVEPLGEQPAPRSPIKRNYRRMASDGLDDQLGTTLAPDEMEALTNLVAAQWQRHQGHACIFVDVHQELIFTLTELSNGHCNMTVQRQQIDLTPMFNALGFAPEAIPQTIRRLNLGQPIEFRDRNGVPSVMRHNPIAMAIEVRSAVPGAGPPPPL